MGGSLGIAEDLIPILTVDSYMAARGIVFVDFLKVDTEGYDYNVLKGASSALKAHAVGALIFEYHGIGLWKETITLQQVVQELDEQFGYVCYFAGRPTPTRLTRCWNAVYEFRHWSNVLCAPSSGGFARALEKGSFLGVLWPDRHAKQLHKAS